MLLASLLATSVAFSLPAQANLPARNVETGSSYATIQEAINADATLNGHTIHVEAGIYHENVVVNKSLSLIGENRLNTVIDANASGNVVQITADHVNVTGFTMQNSMPGLSGVYIYHSNEANVSQNILTNDHNGIHIYGSNNSNIVDNDVFGNQFGIHLYGSGNNNLSGNNVYNNMNGIHLDISDNNTLFGNKVWSNTGNGIYLYESAGNTVSGNNVFSNYGRGIRLHYSSGNTLSSNLVSSNGYGIYLYGSAKNTLTSNNASFNNESGVLLQGSSDISITSNILSYNIHGIWLIASSSNTVSGNNVSSNSEYGARFWNSSGNVFIHNSLMKNLVKNVEQPSNTSILNLWDDGAEGNFWDDYNFNVTNVNGIGDKPYVVDPQALGVYSQDAYPLMGQFYQFSTAIENRSYTATFVSNFTITSFRYDRGPDNKTNLMSFDVNTTDVNATQGTGFCLVCIPHELVTPPYVVTTDQAPPLSYNVVRTNGTHTWVYFTYAQSTRGLTVKPVLPVVVEVPIWSLWWFWGIFGLALIVAILVPFSVKYHRKVAEQAKLLRDYSPFVIAEALFKADIDRRGLKIREFEKKYGVKIQPRGTLEDVMRSLETKEKEEKS
jgi:parallel beta-helix repeat protein